jgi:hypothetical protein
MMSSPIQRATATGRITHVTRRRLVEGFAAMPTAHWSGDLDEPDFLARLYPLEQMPSIDPRYDTAGRDIFQHRVLNPLDWPDDWIFRDDRFGLADNDEALRASPRRYAEMVAADRELHLAGYEVVRFGGAEFQSQEQSLPMLRRYFTRLFIGHGYLPESAA